MSNGENETKTRTYDLSMKAIDTLARKAKKDRRTVSNYLTVLLENLDDEEKKDGSA